MNIRILLILLCCPMLLTGQTKKFSLEKAIDYGLKNHDEIKRGQINLLDADAQIIQRRAVGLPKINATFNLNRNLSLPVSLVPAQFVDPNAMEGEFAELQFGTKNNLSAGMEVNMLLFDASYFTALRAAKRFKDFTKKENDQIHVDVANDVISAYLPNLLVRESIAILDLNMANLEQLHRETSALYKQGFAEKLDVDRLELSISNLNTEKSNLLKQKSQLENIMRLRMGMPRGALFELVDDIDGLLQRYQDMIYKRGPNAHTKRSEYLLSEVGIQLSELNVEAQKNAFLPTVRAFGNISQQGQGDRIGSAIWNPQALIGLTVNVPIFSGFATKANVKRAQYELEIQRIQQRQLINAIDLEIKNAEQSATVAKSVMAERQQNRDLAQRIYDTTKIKYKEGVGSSLEINQAEQSLYLAQSNLLNARYELLVALIEFKRTLGL